MRAKLAWLSAALVTLSLTSCSSSPQTLIVGKCEAVQPGVKLTAEFGKDRHAQLTPTVRCSARSWVGVEST